MKTRFKVYAGLEKHREVDKIIIPPDVSLGDFPYYIEVENNLNEKFAFFKSEYVKSLEKSDRIIVDNAEILIGEISGKIYEVTIRGSLNLKVLTEISKFVKEYHPSSTKKERYRNNIHFSLKIIREAYEGIVEKFSQGVEKKLIDD